MAESLGRSDSVGTGPAGTSRASGPDPTTGTPVRYLPLVTRSQASRPNDNSPAARSHADPRPRRTDKLGADTRTTPPTERLRFLDYSRSRRSAPSGGRGKISPRPSQPNLAETSLFSKCNAFASASHPRPDPVRITPKTSRSHPRGRASLAVSRVTPHLLVTRGIDRSRACRRARAARRRGRIRGIRSIRSSNRTDSRGVIPVLGERLVRRDRRKFNRERREIPVRCKHDISTGRATLLQVNVPTVFSGRRGGKHAILI
jgi:hypothetical protein